MKFLPKLKKLNGRGISHVILPLLIVVAVGVTGTYLLVASHAASPRPHGISIGNTAKASPKNGILVVFSQNGDYNRAEISVEGGAPKDYTCGTKLSAMNAFNETNAAVVKIGQPTAKKPGYSAYTCTPTSGSAQYRVKFGFNTIAVDGGVKITNKDTPGSGPNLILPGVAVDIDAGTCTFVHANGETTKVPNNPKGCNGDYTEKPMTAVVTVLPDAYKAGSTKITGYVNVTVPKKDLTREQCGASVRVDDAYSNGTTKANSYSLPLRYVKDAKLNGGNGYCVIKLATPIGKTRTQAQVVSITANLIANRYFSVASAGASVTLPANSSPTGGTPAP